MVGNKIILPSLLVINCSEGLFLQAVLWNLVYQVISLSQGFFKIAVKDPVVLSSGRECKDLIQTKILVKQRDIC